LWVLFVGKPVVFEGRASPGVFPKEVKITNLSPNSFTVSWITSQAVRGNVLYGTSENEIFFKALDDRGEETSSLIHYVTLKELKPGTTYYFNLVSGGDIFDNGGRPYLITTPQLSGATPSPPFILKGRAGEEGIVYFSLNESLPVSSLTDERGNFLLNLNNALRKDATGYYQPQKGEVGYLLLQTPNAAKTKKIIVDEEEIVSFETENKSLGEVQKIVVSNLPAPQEKTKISFWSKMLNFFRNIIISLGFSKNG